jgi:hypothetical protein
MIHRRGPTLATPSSAGVRSSAQRGVARETTFEIAQDRLLALTIRLGADVNGSVGDGLKLPVGVEDDTPRLPSGIEGGFQFAFVWHGILSDYFASPA